MSEFLQFGYIGLIGLLITLCYRILQAERARQASVIQALIITAAFSIISLIGGVSGYLWASKELEITKTRLSSIEVKNSQIEQARTRHLESTKSLRAVFDSSLKSFDDSVLDSTRSQKLAEAERVNKLLSFREADYQNELKAIAESLKSE